MHVIFLGTGTSQGIPVITCQCRVCKSSHFKDKRLRSSVYIETDDLSLVIDTGPDFRQQMLRENISRLDAVLFTHEHKDHIAGLDDVRAFNYLQKKPMPVYATPQVIEALKREYHYAFSGESYPGIPQLILHPIHPDRPFKIQDTLIIPILAYHYRMPVLGFRIKNFTYITDANYLPPEEQEKIKGSEILVLNALRKEKHISHFTLTEAIALAQQLQVPQTYLTHISHLMGLHEEVNSTLPKGIQLAYDGLVVEC